MRRRSRSLHLRGSVTQNTIRAREPSHPGLLWRLTALAGTLLLLIGALIWLWQIGWPQREAGRIADAGLHLTQEAQFAVHDIQVEGRQQTSKDAIVAALGVSEGAPILGFDPSAAQARIAKLPWVAAVTVERRLPDTIVVQITERVPLARWQHDNRTVVIDGEGKELPDILPQNFASLPLVVGSDAPAETQDLLDALKNYPTVQSAMTAAVRVGDRRWDLHLAPKITARLPEKDVDLALARLSQLIAGDKILERNVTAIDLRLPNKLTIEPSDAPAKSGDAL